MKKTLLIIGICALFSLSSAYAQREKPTSSAKVEVGKMHVLSQNGGDFISDNTSTAFYLDSAGTRKHLLYMSSLWIGGLNETGDLHLAAMTYRQGGHDFYPGPISGDSVQSSRRYNNIHTISKTDIADHLNTGGIRSVNEWPGNGVVADGEPAVIAPFVDLNANQKYEPANGEYPLIRGDRTLFSVFNDDCEHGETGGKRMGIEAQTMIYTFENNPNIDDVVFVNLMVTNKSNTKYTDVHLGIFADFELGNYADDFVGCDESRNLFYAYNGDDDDEVQYHGFGTTPPAVGVVFLNRKMDAFARYYNDFNPVSGNPRKPEDYYNYLKGKYMDSSNVLDHNKMTTRFAFSGNVTAKTGWTEEASGSFPSDRRGVGSIGPFTFEPGETICLEFAYVYGQGTDRLNSIDVLKDRVDDIQKRFNQGEVQNNFSLCNNKLASINGPKKATQSIKCFPNPATSMLFVEMPEGIQEMEDVMVFDDLGRKVITYSSTPSLEEGIDLKNLSPGIYTLQLRANNQIYLSRFVKSN